MKKRYACVQFDKENRWSEAKNYQFVTDIDDLVPGCLVVVHTQHGYKVARFVKYDEVALFKNPKWIVQRIDVESHRVNLEREQKVREIKEKMEQRRQKLEEIQIYKILAKEDPEMESLMNEFSTIQELDF